MAATRDGKLEWVGNRVAPRGFTLVEVLMALVLSALVMTIMAASFRISVRFWDKLHSTDAQNLPHLADLLRLQTGTLFFQSVEPRAAVLVQGTKTSLTLVTSHSVRAITPGGPVEASYGFQPDQQTLMYSEISLGAGTDPSRPKKQFEIKGIKDFSLSYVQADGTMKEDWSAENGIPRAVVVRLTGIDGSILSRVLIPGFFNFGSSQEGA